MPQGTRPEDHSKNKYAKERDDIARSDHPQACKRRNHIQPTKKVNCPAQIYIIEIARFPDFKIEENVKHLRDKQSKKLKKALIDGKVVKFERVYIMKLPAVTEHTGHPFRRRASH
ncbi:uncharacterized protein LOC143023892 [Oratosquilla oratoria]|uniref:uncharacterized protein LOC143023892 n=1 Tax=Oratosquilla oratoria TaxID=337810 RepID=UPI003F7699B8